MSGFDPIAPGELAQDRADAEELLPDTATLLDRHVVSDGGGGQTVTYTARAGTVSARVAPVGGGDSGPDRGGRISDRSTHIITLPAGTLLSEADQVQIAAQKYEVTLVRERSFELVRRVEAREVE